MASKRQQQAGFLLPDPVTGYDLIDVCLKIPDAPEYRQAFLGHINLLGKWFVWEKSYLPGDTRAKEAAQLWRDTLFNYLFIGEDCMSGCCDDPPAIYRYNSDGTYQRSTDGGVTWTDAPQYDYRNTSTIFPPPSALGIDNSKCQAADSAVKTIDEEVIQALNESFAAAQILALITAVLLAILSAGSLAAITPLVTAIVSAIVDVGVTATQAAFTDEVWSRLRCNIYCHMDSDSSIDAAGLAAVLSKISSSETGIVQSVLYGIINAAGVVGLTNMIRSNKGDPDADCSSCDCVEPGCHADDWHVYVGTEISRTDNTLTVRTALSGGFQTINISTANPELCCKISVGIVGWGSYAWIRCGDPIDSDHIVNNTPFADECLSWFNMANPPGNTEQDVTFTFSDCP